MSVRSFLIGGAVAATATVAPATAAVAPADIRLTRVTDPPRTIAAGDQFIVRVTIRNKGETAGRGVLRIFLKGTRGPYAMPLRLIRVPTGRFEGLTFKRYTIQLTVPLNAAKAKHWLRSCLKVEGDPDEQCQASRRIQVTA